MHNLQSGNVWINRAGGRLRRAERAVRLFPLRFNPLFRDGQPKRFASRPGQHHSLPASSRVSNWMGDRTLQSPSAKAGPRSATAWEPNRSHRSPAKRTCLNGSTIWPKRTIEKPQRTRRARRDLGQPFATAEIVQSKQTVAGNPSSVRSGGTICSSTEDISVKASIRETRNVWINRAGTRH